MNFINYISNIAIPFTILVIIVYGIAEKQSVFDVFLEGAKEGIQIVIVKAKSKQTCDACINANFSCFFKN